MNSPFLKNYNLQEANCYIWNHTSFQFCDNITNRCDKFILFIPLKNSTKLVLSPGSRMGKVLANLFLLLFKFFSLQICRVQILSLSARILDLNLTLPHTVVKCKIFMRMQGKERTKQSNFCLFRVLLTFVVQGDPE